jgi:hypothetical protein
MGNKKKVGAFVVPSVFGLLLGFILICWDLGFSRWGSLYLKNIRNVRYPFQPWSYESWLLGILLVFWRKTLAPGGVVHPTGIIKLYIYYYIINKLC